jgi:hypothetical protein
MDYFLCSPSGARKEEQGQTAQKEGPGRVESLLVYTFRSMILWFDKGRNHSSHVPSLGCHTENMMFCFVISTSA